ncbi:MAG: oligosaccharide flippase family protein [Actinomycetota bacterium]|nr:oligosaccharide flippase family protein [Actinomycetota bacterium]
MAESGERPPVRAVGAGRNSLLAFLTQMSTAAFTAVLTIYLIRTLGPDDFGIFSLAVSIGTLLLLPADFGVTNATARYVAERHGDWRAVAGLLSDGLRLKLIAGAVVSVALGLAAGPIADAYGEPDLAWPLRWMALAVLGQSLVAFYRYQFLALRDAAVGFRIVIGEAAVEASTSILLVAIAGGAAAASAGRAVGYGFGTVLAIAITLRRFGRPAIERYRPLREARRQIGRYAGALFAIESSFAASTQMPPLMIGGFLSARDVGVFSAPARLLIFLQYPGISVANGVAPRLAHTEGRGPDVATFVTALRYLIVFQALLLAPLVVWAEPIVDLALGPGYERSADLLRELAPYVFVAGLAALLSTGVNYLGEARRRLPISIFDLFLMVAMLAALLPTVGLSGAAYALDIVTIIYVLFHLWVLRKLVDVPLRPLVLATVRGLAAAGAAAGVLFAFGTDDLAVWEWGAGGAGALAAFGAVVVVLGEISVRELREAAARVRSPRSSPSR